MYSAWDRLHDWRWIDHDDQAGWLTAPFGSPLTHLQPLFDAGTSLKTTEWSVATANPQPIHAAPAVETVPAANPLPTDPIFSWHLSAINVEGAWADYTGAGTAVAVVDDGFHYTHPDLNDNYDTASDWDFRDNDASAYASSSTDGHGTNVAGMIAAEANGLYTVGVAYDATLVGVRIGYSSFGTPTQYANALDYAWQHADVVNNSWSYGGNFYDDFNSYTFLGNAQAIEDGAHFGRGGLGTVWVFAAGNGREDGDNVNYHNYQNSPYAIAVAATDSSGNVAEFSNPGAALLVAAPGVYVQTTESTNTYVTTSGTSFSAPTVAGVVSLMFEANPDLGYRDVQEILAYSAVQNDPTDPGWQTNGAFNWNGGGLHFNHDYGFGLVDATAAVRLAETWTTQSTFNNQIHASASSAPNLAIPDNDGIFGITDSVTILDEIEIDTVEVVLDIDHTWIGDLVVGLISPSGTETTLVNRPGGGYTAGANDDDFIDFTFSANTFWGENSQGTWELLVYDLYADDVGVLNDWTLIVNGDPITNDDVFVFTDAFSEVAGSSASGASFIVEPFDPLAGNGHEVFNASAVTTDTHIDLRSDSLGGTGSIIDGVTILPYPWEPVDDAYTGDGNDTLIGNSLDNLLWGGRGDDLIEGGGGNDSLFGGAGTDTAVYSGNLADYQIVTVGDETTVSVLPSAGSDEGTDTLVDFEYLQFADATINVGATGSPPTAVDDVAATDEDTVIDIDVLANDSDPDFDPLSVILASSTSTYGGADISVNADGTIQYDPTDAFALQILPEGATYFHDSFTYTVSDGIGGTDTGEVIIQVIGVNDAPVADVVNLNIDENLAAGTVVGSMSATDVDIGDVLDFAFASGGDGGGLFAIDAATGQITTTAPLDYETATGYSLSVIVSDGALSDIATVTVDVNDIDETPPPTGDALIDAGFDAATDGFVYVDDAFRDTDAPVYASGTWQDAGGTEGGVLAVDLGGINNTNVYGMSGGWQAAFSLAQATDVTLTFRYNLTIDSDYEGDEYTEVLAALDGGLVGGTIDRLDGDGNGGADQTTGWQTVQIDLGNLAAGDHTITLGGFNNQKTYYNEASEILFDDVSVTTPGGGTPPGNQPPSDIALSATSVDENAAGAVIGTLSVTDPDDTTHSFAVDDGRFEVVGGDLRLKAGQSLDFETEPTVSLDITATDPAANDYTETFVITAADVNEAPFDLALSNATILENDVEAIVGTLIVSDPDAVDSFSFDVAGDPRFEVINGVLKLNQGEIVDFEAEPTITLNILVRDSGGFDYDEDFTITVIDQNDLPVGVADIAATDEDTAIDIDVLANDVDQDSDPLTIGDFATQSLLGAAVSLNSDGTLHYDPTGVAGFDALVAGEVIVDEILYSAVDGAGLSEDIIPTSVLVTVTGVNDAPTASDDTFALNENLAAGAIVGSVAASDPEGDALTYAFAAGSNLDGLFAIDAATGEITTTAPLDYETAASHSLQVEVFDGEFTDSATITVNVNDIDEINDPPTDITLSATTVAENADGVIVGLLSVSDPDVGDSHTFSVSDARFEFLGSALKLKAGESLDFETEPSVSLDITATDTGGNSYTETFIINVNDLNEAPTVEYDVFTVDENMPIGTVVGTVSASDPDGDVLSYSFTTDGNPWGRFAIDPDSGEITTATNLNHEAMPIDGYSVEVEVSDGQFTDVSTIDVFVNDVNEMPNFIMLSPNSVDENAVGAVIGDVEIHDPDANETHTITLYDSRFEVVGTTVKLADGQSLDFESDPDVYVNFTVTDSGNNQVNGHFLINVNDVNEAPTVSDDTFALDENLAAGTLVGTVTASDPDGGDVVGFAFAPGGDGGGLFAIDAATGQITTTAPLDYETAASHALSVEVTDGEFTDSASITVNVGDVNEAPTANDDTFALDENLAAGTVVGTVAASDPDGDILSYAFASGGDGGGLFAIDPNTGQIITTAPLDYETANSHALSVEVTDGQFTDAATITVNVGDIDETPPPTGDALIDAGFDAATDGFVYVDDAFRDTDAPVYASGTWQDAGGAEGGVLAVDLGGINNTNVYGMSGGWQAAFSLAQATDVTLTFRYNLTIDSDYEGDEYTEVLAALDGGLVGGTIDRLDGDGNGGADQTTGWQTVQIDLGNLAAGDHTITLGGFNNQKTYYNEASEILFDDVSVTTPGGGTPPANQPPSDIALSAASVDENAAGAVIGTLSVTDPDDASHTFTVDDGRFEVVGGDLRLKAGQSLDFETEPSVSLDVTATDPAGNDYTETFVITVIDQNDLPVGVADIAQTDEDTAIDIDVLANDIDQDSDPLTVGDFANVSDLGATITMNADGTLHYDPTSAGLEALPANLAIYDTFEYTVIDGDGLTEGSTNTTVEVFVMGVNDAPTASDDTFAVNENLAAGAIVGTVAASDPEGDSLTYAFAAGSNLDGLFAIDPNSGQITTTAPLDYESATSHTLDVVVSDGEFSDNATITVSVNNLDDTNQPPTVSDGTFALDENLTAGAMVGTVTAGDPDGDALSFAFAAGSNLDGLFAIDPNSGQITTTTPLDHEAAASHSLDVVVSDGELSDSATISVDVNDVNEAPTASDDVFSLDENLSAGTVVGTVTASDPDDGDVLGFAFAAGGDGGGLFAIDAATGQITTTAPLDYETATGYSLSVIVSDGALSDTATVTVNVGDIDETPPPTGVTLIDAGFDAATDGFVYVDDAFRATDAPVYANGTWQDAGGAEGGVLAVELGGINNTNVYGMSGGWQADFSLAQATDVTLTFRYNLTIDSDYEGDEYTEVLAALDGGLVGGTIDRLDGDGNGGADQTTGWQTVQIDLGTLDAGDHTIMLGGFNNQKTYYNEASEILFDDVSVTAGGGSALTAGSPADAVLGDLWTDFENEDFKALLEDYGDESAATCQPNPFTVPKGEDVSQLMDGGSILGASPMPMDGTLDPFEPSTGTDHNPLMPM